MPIQKLGRYEVAEVLGQGAMGIVYKGIDPKIGRTVALKTLKTTGEIPADQLSEFKRRFSQEAQSAGRLAHPNIVTIYDVGEEEGLAYIAMEFIKGKALDEYIAEKHAFTIDQIVSIMTQICEGLGYAHKNGVIHRDIKPANIVLTDDKVAKITDFGIAKITSMSATQSGVVVGTPSYMSPEQITGKGIDNRSDIFSIGAVFYELLTHEKAFPGDNITTVMYRVVHENPAPVTSINMAVPTQFTPILLKAMAKNPADRYPDAETMSKDIQNYKAFTAMQSGATQVFRPDSAGTVMMTGAADVGAVTSGGMLQSAVKNKKLLILSGTAVAALIVLLFLVFGNKAPSNSASLELSLNIFDGTVRVDSADFNIDNGKLFIPKLEASEHSVNIKHEGYEEFKTKLLFAENEQKTFNVEMKLLPVQFPAGADTGFITVNARPAVVKVLTNDGAFICYSPVNKLPFPVGKRTLVFSRENYVSKVLDIDLRKKRELKLTPSLDAKKGLISLADVNPKKVQLFVDNNLLKPEKDGVTYTLQIGKQKILLKQDGFKPLEKEITVSEKDVLKIDASLEQLYGKLAITSNPDGADVFIDGSNVGKTPLTLESVAAGVRDIKVQKGAMTSIKKITVAEGKENSADFKLQALVGYLKFLINPWAKIYIDGREYGASPPLDNLELKPGTYKIKMENPAFKAVTRTVTITAGASATLQYDFK